MKTYIGTKIIQAEPMDESSYHKFMGNPVLGHPQNESRPGYKVVYPDGYISWSPEETFELAYREITPGEVALFVAMSAHPQSVRTPSE